MKKYMKVILPALLIVALLIAALALYGPIRDGLLPQNGLAGAESGETSVPGSSEAEQGSAEEEAAPESADGGEAEAEPAPDFTVYDGEGNAVKLSDQIGKPVVINFWATWCPYCVREMPDFQEVYDEYGDSVVFMMVNATDGSRETQEKAQAYIEEKGFTFPVVYDLELDAVSSYGVSSFPSTYVIGADGTMAGYAVGMIDAASLRNALDTLV